MYHTLLLILASLSHGHAASIIHPRQSPAPLKLMPLGDSITLGYQSTSGNGYRQALYDLLTQDGFTVDMVGALQSGNMSDPDHEGWAGFTIAEVNDKASLDVPSRLPNLYTVDLGTNDADRDEDVAGMGERLNATIENLWSMTPDATVVLSTLTPNGDATKEPRVVTANEQYRTLVGQWQSEGRRIVLAELHDEGGLQFPGDFADTLHPNDGGYAKMGNIWFESIKDAEARGFLGVQ